jgi:hypothetical protein
MKLKECVGRSCSCGLWPVLFGGWCEAACEKHDWYYVNSAGSAYSRKWVDQEFLRQCLELSKKGRFKIGKKVASYAMYAVVRIGGGIVWDGAR